MPTKILKDSVFTELAIILSASLTVSQPIRLNLPNTVHLHYTYVGCSQLLLVDLTVKKDFDLLLKIPITKNMQKPSFLANFIT